MRHLLAAAAFLFLGPGAVRAGAPGVSAFTLANGLDVVVIEDHRAPVVTHTIWYRVGSRDDPPGRAGMAHFLEHLMFQATDRLAPGEYSRTIAENGGADNAATSMDRTVYFARVAADRLDLVMGMEADRMANLVADAPAVDTERAVVTEERRQVVDGDPGGAFRETLMATLYPGSAEGRPTIGSEAEIAGLTWQDAQAFYRAHYAPDNALLVVAGDVDPVAVRAMAKRHFGPIPAAAAVPERPLAEPPLPAGHRVVLHDARVTEPQLVRLTRVPPRRTGDQRQAAAFVVLADLLGGPRVTSTMERTLVSGDGIALAAQASYGETGLGPQTFTLALVPKPGVDPARAEAALDALVAAVVAAPPDPAEVERIKGRLRASDIYALDDVGGRAGRVGVALTSGLTLDDVAAWPGALQAVTPADVQAAAAALDPDATVTGWLLPAEGQP